MKLALLLICPRPWEFKAQKTFLGRHDWGGARDRINVIGALLGAVLLTVFLFEGAIHRAIFDVWFEQDLLPKLPPRSLVLMDNATFHKNETLQALLKQKGQILEYLPPDSPDLNPIEHKWNQAKALNNVPSNTSSNSINYHQIIKRQL
jgi:transposase